MYNDKCYVYCLVYGCRPLGYSCTSSANCCNYRVDYPDVFGCAISGICDSLPNIQDLNEFRIRGNRGDNGNGGRDNNGGIYEK